MRKQSIAFCLTAAMLVNAVPTPARADDDSFAGKIIWGVATALAVGAITRAIEGWAATPAKHHGKVATRALNIRSCPDANCALLNLDNPLVEGATIEITGDAQNGWLPIKATVGSQSYAGFVNGKFITVID